ncbi:Imm6 family immunity protein [Variovorax atrisoli]|uniref:Imm6 family immunity protein n=1 Tax=Variovorax atrisoli TaxID=3394203 RepID=UPI003AB0A5DE
MDCDFTLPKNLALGLLIADRLLDASDLTGEDRVLLAQGLKLSWEWVKGRDVDPRLICEYIDGEANLPFRSTLYEANSDAGRAMTAAFLVIGLTALQACREMNMSPSESVENFGEGEWHALMNIAPMLSDESRARIAGANLR